MKALGMWSWAAAAAALAPASAGARPGGSGVIELERLVPQPPAAPVFFGSALALDGDWMLATAKYESVGGLPQTGAAYVFQRVAGTWQEAARLLPSDLGALAWFGASGDLDGNLVVVGAPRAQNDAGAAYVFQTIAGSWTEVARLTPSDAAPNEFFGGAVAVEGDTVFVGASSHSHGGVRTGAVYVFKRNGGSWDQVAELRASDGAQGDGFGTSIAVQGSRLAIGALFGDAPGTSDCGAVYVFEGAAGAWNETAKIVAEIPGNQDYFGGSVSLSADSLAIGASRASPPGTSNRPGLAYVFDHTGAAWTQAAWVKGSSANVSDYFGIALELEGDALLVGAHLDEYPAPTNSGQAYLFTRSAGVWTELAVLHAGDAQSDDRFGVALALEGARAAIGAEAAHGPGGALGAVYTFALPLGAPPGAEYCFGQGCPCGNDDPAAGCANSGGGGARLLALGSPGLAAADLALGASDLLVGQPALLFAGTTQPGGGAGVGFGDGLRCAGGAVVRLGVRAPDAYRCASWSGDLAAQLGVAPGDQRFLQVWYRDPLGGPCASGFNLTQAVAVTFEP